MSHERLGKFLNEPVLSSWVSPNGRRRPDNEVPHKGCGHIAPITRRVDLFIRQGAYEPLRYLRLPHMPNDIPICLGEIRYPGYAGNIYLRDKRNFRAHWSGNLQSTSFLELFLRRCLWLRHLLRWSTLPRLDRGWFHLLFLDEIP